MNFKVMSTALISLLVSSAAFATETKSKTISPAETMAAIGFSTYENTTKSLRLKFRDEKAYVMSKEKFSSEEEANNFCKTEKLTLSKEGLDHVLLAAMSGAATADSDVSKAISFDLGGESGIWAWTGDGTNTIIAIFNGKGMSSHKFTIGEIKKVAATVKNPTAAKVSAVCD